MPFASVQERMAVSIVACTSPTEGESMRDMFSRASGGSRARVRPRRLRSTTRNSTSGQNSRRKPSLSRPSLEREPSKSSGSCLNPAFGETWCGVRDGWGAAKSFRAYQRREARAVDLTDAAAEAARPALPWAGHSSWNSPIYRRAALPVVLLDLATAAALPRGRSVETPENHITMVMGGGRGVVLNTWFVRGSADFDNRSSPPRDDRS
jgi:hypothetical protein